MVELVARPVNDEGRIRAASTCRGDAEVIINGVLFAYIISWMEFTRKLKQKFKGTCSVEGFMNHLASKKLQENQALVDLHLEIKSVVYSAVQDFAGELSSPEAVIHHAFVQALPPYLQEVCSKRPNQDRGACECCPKSLGYQKTSKT